MDISIEYRDGRWTISPNPAKVYVGDKVTWLLSWPKSPIRLVRWKIYFGPFRELDLQTTTLLLPTITAGATASGAVETGASHSGIVGPLVAEDPGEYKYGVSVTNAESDKAIDDEDPKLIVLQRPT